MVFFVSLLYSDYFFFSSRDLLIVDVLVFTLYHLFSWHFSCCSHINRAMGL